MVHFPAVFIKKNDYIGMKADEKRTINADALLADAIALREKSERQREEVERLRENIRGGKYEEMHSLRNECK